MLNYNTNLIFPKLLPFFYEDGDGGWYVLEDFTIEYKLNNIIYLITCKKGFDYDGASIPTIMRSIVGDKMCHKLIVAALFHDLFYSSHVELFNKQNSDIFFYDIIKRYEGNWAKRQSCYSAVKLFGASSWIGEKTPEDILRYKNFIDIKVK